MEKKRNLWVIPTEKPSRLFIDNDDKKLRLFKELNVSKYCKNQNIYITSDEELVLGGYHFNSKYGDKPQKTNQRDIDSRKHWEEEDYYITKIVLTTDQELIQDGVQAIDDEFLEWFVKNPNCEGVEVDKTIPYNFDDLDSVRQDKFLELFYKSELFDEIKYNDVFDWSVNEGKDFLKLYPTFKIIIPKEEPKQETLGRIPEKQDNCCTPVGHIRRYKDCIGCDRKPKQETLEEYIEKSYPKDDSRYDFTVTSKIRNGIREGAKWQQEQDKNKYSEEEVLDLLYKRDLYLISKISSDLTKEWFEQFKNK